jgi:hypothetical protein
MMASSFGLEGKSSMTKQKLVRSASALGISLVSAAATAQDLHSQHHAVTKASAMQTPQSLAAEHRAAAVKAGRDEYVRFSDGLAAHARLEEEEILYPAAVLVGRYVTNGAGTVSSHKADL